MRLTEVYAPEILVRTDADLELLDPNMPAAELKLLLAEHVKLSLLPLNMFSVLNVEPMNPNG
jgi:hypothetical protein